MKNEIGMFLARRKGRREVFDFVLAISAPLRELLVFVFYWGVAAVL
jgi:hypothetical protein